MEIYGYYRYLASFALPSPAVTDALGPTPHLRHELLHQSLQIRTKKDTPNILP